MKIERRIGLKEILDHLLEINSDLLVDFASKAQAHREGVEFGIARKGGDGFDPGGDNVWTLNFPSDIHPAQDAAGSLAMMTAARLATITQAGHYLIWLRDSDGGCPPSEGASVQLKAMNERLDDFSAMLSELRGHLVLILQVNLQASCEILRKAGGLLGDQEMRLKGREVRP